MGQDISLFVERWEDGRWQCQVPVRDLAKWPRVEGKRTFWGPYGCVNDQSCFECNYEGGVDPNCEHCLGTGEDLRWYHHRNYILFNILNGRDQGVGRELGATVAGPRDQPTDASLPVARHQDCYGWSWQTLDELLALDWGRAIHQSGAISLLPGYADPSFAVDDFAAWVARGRGRPLGGYRATGHLLTVAEAERWLVGDFQPCHEPSCLAAQAGRSRLAMSMPRAPNGRKGSPCNQHNVSIEWSEPAREVCVDFLAFLRELVMPMLPAEYHEIRSVLDDALEDKRPSQDVIDELTLQAWAYEETIRLVYGFS